MNAIAPVLGAADAAYAGRRILWVCAEVPTNPQGEDILKRNGFAVRRLTTGLDDTTMPGVTGADLVILELAHTEPSALAFCRRLSDGQAGAVLVIAPRMGVLERVAILEFGADGVLPHSVHPIELLARVRALLRRAARAGAANDADKPAAWRFETPMGNLRSSTGSVVQLARADAELLLALAIRPGQLVDRATLVQVLHESAASATARSIDARVARLRRAMAPCAAGTIRTVRGRGYVWEPSSVFQLVNPTPPPGP